MSENELLTDAKCDCSGNTDDQCSSCQTPAEPASPAANADNAGKSHICGEAYCSSCGKLISSKASICVHCGAPTSTSSHKSRSTAIILAVFLGFWTWLYTYKTDSMKFWLNLAGSVVTVGCWGIVAWIWAIVESISRPEEFYANY